MKIFFLLAAAPVLFLLSCSQPPVPEAGNESYNSGGDLRSSLIGTWQSDALVVGIDTMNNSDLNVVLEITKDEWCEKLKLQPIQTIFNANNTYVSAYVSTDGKLLKITAGKWDVGKNQLRIHQLFPIEKQMDYRIDLTAGSAELRSRLDFDGDGKNDDMLFCQMKKVS